MPLIPSPTSPGPIVPQFDQTLIGLGIYIPLNNPSSPSSSSSITPSTQLLSPPPFLTPSTQTRRSRSRGLAPRSLGTKGGFRSSPIQGLPRSIYSGDDNPFLPLPSDSEGLESGINIVGEQEGEMGKRNKEYDNIILDLDLTEEELPESTFPQTPTISRFGTPISRSRSRQRRMEGMEGIGGRPGPDPFSTTSSIPSTPRLSSDSLAPLTPSTPIPESSPIGHTRTGPSMGLIGSALSEDIAPVPNPLFVASVALSVVLGVLIVGIVSCSVVYCRRTQGRKVGVDEENGSGSPKRDSLDGRYKRKGEAKTPDSSRAFGRIGFFGKRDKGENKSVGENKGREIGSRTPSILKSPTGYSCSDNIPNSPGAGPGECGKVSFVESPQGPSILVGILQVHRQLYTPPSWQQQQQPSSSSSASPVSPTPIPTTPARPKSTSSSTSKISYAPSHLTSIQEETPNSPSIHTRSPSLHTTNSRCSSQFLSVDSHGGISYNSCSDNSSMTTHASDDAFGYTSRPPSLAESLFGASVDDLTNPRRESSASSVSFAPSEEYPSYNLPEEGEEEGSEGDISIDTVSIVTPLASPTPNVSLGSPVPLAGAMIHGRKSARRRSTGGSPSPALRTRFDIADDVESGSDEDEDESLEGDDGGDGEEEEEGETESEGEISAGPRGFMTGSRKIIFLEQTVIKPQSQEASSPSKETSGGVIKRALSVFRNTSPTPPSTDNSLTPIRSSSPSPSPRCTPLSIITHQSDLDPISPCSSLHPSSSSPTIQTTEDIEGIGRFSTASWDQLTSDPTTTFDAYYLGGESRPNSTASTTSSTSSDLTTSTTSLSTEGRIQREEDEEMWAEINLARISFGLLSSSAEVTTSREDRRSSLDCGLINGGGTGNFELDAFPEPASHLPKISVTCH